MTEEPECKKMQFLFKHFLSVYTIKGCNCREPIDTDPSNFWLLFSTKCGDYKANSFESLCLWLEWNKRVNWIQGDFGRMVTVGHINEFPITVSLFWNTIDNEEVLFYEASSRVVDYSVVNKWLHENCSMELYKTDAMNFHNIILNIVNSIC